jgi:hypothetical protein
MFTWSWFRNAVTVTVAGFVLGFVGVAVSAGTNNLNASTIHAAITAGIIAALAAVQSVFAALVAPKASDTAFVGRAFVNRVGSIMHRPPVVDPEMKATLTALANLPPAIDRQTSAISTLVTTLVARLPLLPKPEPAPNPDGGAASGLVTHRGSEPPPDPPKAA